MKRISESPLGNERSTAGGSAAAVALSPSATSLRNTASLALPGGWRFASWRRIVAATGPGLLVAVGYVDPGNWATDVSGGARYGYALLSIILLANLIAMVAQALCVRLALGTGRSLAELCRERFSPPVVAMLWLLAEIAMVATDIAELVGSAVALNLLFGVDLLSGMLLVSACTFVILLLGGNDWRLRSIVFALMIVVATSFLVLLLLAKPDWAEVATGLVPPRGLATDPAMLLIAVGIIGATVMPHNLYLHSGLLAPTAGGLDAAARQRAIKTNVRDSHTALGGAFFINAAILVAAGAVFHAHGITEIADLGAAHQLLNPILGSSVAATIFAVALLAAGQSSTITCTLAGQLMMEGFLRIRLSPLVRRLVIRIAALGPAMLYFTLAGQDDSSRLLILSQVVLSLQLPFAIIPLVAFVGNRRLMGAFVLGPMAKAVGWAMALLVLAFNAVLIWQMAV